jgi:hypothetical protein
LIGLVFPKPRFGNEPKYPLCLERPEPYRLKKISALKGVSHDLFFELQPLIPRSR